MFNKFFSIYLSVDSYKLNFCVFVMSSGSLNLIQQTKIPAIVIQWFTYKIFTVITLVINQMKGVFHVSLFFHLLFLIDMKRMYV